MGRSISRETDRVYGGLEAGGTHFACAVGTGPEDLRAVDSFATTTPSETIARAVEFFRLQQRRRGLSGIGIASFGPVDLDRGSPTYGHITSTPKPGWASVDLPGAVRRSLGVPVGFDTDVNTAALAEHTWGSAKGLDTFLYLTVGTGIGGGGMVNGRPMHGLVHPEMGHIRVPHDLALDGFAGCCPYHGDCLEGLACGPAIERRWGVPPESIPPGHPAWDLEATYLGMAVANYICTFSPQRIVIGGGVMRQPQLLPLVRSNVQRLLGGYVRASEILDHIDRYIVAPSLGSRAGVLGAIALARQVSA